MTTFHVSIAIERFQNGVSSIVDIEDVGEKTYETLEEAHEFAAELVQRAADMRESDDWKDQETA